jgi:hypothetical protein
LVQNLLVVRRLLLLLLLLLLKIMLLLFLNRVVVEKPDIAVAAAPAATANKSKHNPTLNLLLAVNKFKYCIVVHTISFPFFVHI